MANGKGARGVTKKWNMIVDLGLCVNCHNCVLATKDEHSGNDFPGYSAAQTAPGIDTITVEKHIRGSGTQAEITYVPRMCNHCDDAPCMRRDHRGAIRKRDDGIIIIDPIAAKGGSDIPSLCPYGMIKWDADAAIPHIWNFDAHLLDNGWSAPRCVQACPTSALQAVKLEDADMAAKAADQQLSVLPGAQATGRIYYRSVHRLTHYLAAGTVLHKENGRMECAGALAVGLYEDGTERAVTVTDAFGEFAFGRVSPNCAQIEIRLSDSEGHNVRVLALEGDRSHVLEIVL
jgi:Fe-S-cluster-containing dehydrogenase component